MPRSKAGSQARAMTSSSCSRPTAANMGAAWVQLGAGVELWATMQIVQELLSDCRAWLWVDSASAVQNIRDRHNHVNHLAVERIRSCWSKIQFSI